VFLDIKMETPVGDPEIKNVSFLQFSITKTTKETF
jgi:hypothetical protein